MFLTHLRTTHCGEFFGRLGRTLNTWMTAGLTQVMSVYGISLHKVEVTGKRDGLLG